MLNLCPLWNIHMMAAGVTREQVILPPPQGLDHRRILCVWLMNFTRRVSELFSIGFLRIFHTTHMDCSCSMAITPMNMRTCGKDFIRIGTATYLITEGEKS